MLAIIRDLDDNPDGAALADVLGVAAERGLAQEDVEDALRDLDESGKVFSPKAERYKPT